MPLGYHTIVGKLKTARSVKFAETPTVKPAVGDGGQRAKSLSRLKAAGKDHVEFDMLVIGGGATGLGCALDAARRGYKVAVVDRGDWAEGTSSKSSNMHHGGVRYLQAFVNNPEGSEEQLTVVKNGLAEQLYLYHCAPYLVKPVPIMVPCYTEGQKENYGKLLSKYDELGKDDPYPDSYWCTKSEALFRFPQLQAKNLVGSWIYYDAEQDDARMALLIALSAQEAGACTVNYVGVTSLEKDGNGKIIGANCEDADSNDGETFLVRAKVVINATGPFSDAIRTMDQQDATPIIKPAAGTHIILPSHFSPHGTGLAILETTDGRAMFYLPWQGRTLIGTTDYQVKIEKWPTAPQSDVDFILSEVNRYLEQTVSPATEKDVLAAWVGIRPLATGTQSVTGTAATEATGDADPDDAGATAKVSREHLILNSPSGLVTISGGKWTSYRHMAEDTVDAAVLQAGLPNLPKPSATLINLIGCDGPANMPATKITQANAAPFHKNTVSILSNYLVDALTAEKLTESYGSRAADVCDLANVDKTLRQKICHQHPWIMAQIVYACRFEHARTVADVLSRRTRLCQVDVLAAHNATPKIVKRMGDELGWDSERRQKEVERTEEFLNSMGLQMRLKNTAEARKSSRPSVFAYHHGGAE
mmetsp:Transcript_62079/g.72581  ORF Transcript_62079/g.72581 Transcript_62079/m.72581 type:complete len:646 (-) Transcript_62079:509-2446(-)|eukprot:CAMPEP_0194424560 /NCGR_PEP_ID=MMETSP0176-20130528/23846_1 /TAXON_ID=216777 /ORGANISM="Proboscia alata, Strain PI-D3" /LENGTH=645 /DNA_ID=CAMNT_0039234403 /DNA_START=66 /DNA_END=2003 /DNA_ORIENTATION=-